MTDRRIRFNTNDPDETEGRVMERRKAEASALVSIVLGTMKDRIRMAQSNE